MTTATIDVANQLAELCREQKYIEAVETLYDENIVSIEPMDTEEMPGRLEGKQDVMNKNKWFIDNFEVVESTVYGPYPNGERFAMAFCVTAKNKETQETSKMEEVALYTVKNGKIIQEVFFHTG